MAGGLVGNVWCWEVGLAGKLMILFCGFGGCSDAFSLAGTVLGFFLRKKR